MNVKYFHTKIFVLLIILCIAIYSNYASGQDIDINAPDTVVVDPATFDLSQVSRKYAELTLKAKRHVSSSIDKNELSRLENENKSIAREMDSLLARESYVKMNRLSMRNLNGKLLYWQQNLQTIKNQESNLSGPFNELDKSLKYFDDELEYWSQTIELLKEDDRADALQNQFSEIEQLIDTTKNVLENKSTAILRQLEVITRIVLEIESLIEQIENTILEKQADILLTDQPSVIGINYADKQRWVIPASFVKYYTGNFKYLVDYLRKHLGLVMLNLVLLIVLILLFIRINRLEVKPKDKEGALYLQSLKLILSRPVSAALIIAIFSSVLIYPYRPLMFLDISRLVVAVPIIIILTNILPRRYHLYAYLFGILIFLQILLINLPVSHVFTRLLLLIITSALIAGFSHFLFRYKGPIIKTGRYKNTLRYIIWILLIISVIGFISNLIGKVALSSYLGETVLSIILMSILISFSVMVVNGMIVLLIDSGYGDKLNIIKHNKLKTKQKLIRLINLVAVVTLIYFVLKIFMLELTFFAWLSEFISEERNIGSIPFTWGNILVFFVVIWLSIVLSDFLRALLEEDVLDKKRFKKGVPYTIALMVKYTIVTLGIVIAVSAAGIPTNSLTVILGAFGVGIGFGLQNIFNNLVSGLILLFERPIQIGDTIEVGQLMGNVRSIGIRSSNVRTFDGAEIIVPNGNLISNEVINWTLSDEQRRIEVIVGVSYNSDPGKVRDVLMNLLHKHPDVEKDPRPNVYFQNLGESSLDFRMLFWTSEFDNWLRVKSEILFQVFDDLKAAGIEIPFPQRDLHLRSIDPKVDLNDMYKPNK